VASSDVAGAVDAAMTSARLSARVTGPFQSFCGIPGSFSGVLFECLRWRRPIAQLLVRRPLKTAALFVSSLSAASRLASSSTGIDVSIFTQLSLGREKSSTKLDWCAHDYQLSPVQIGTTDDASPAKF